MGSNYSNACVEALEVINNLVMDDYNKIPSIYIEYLKINSNKDYMFNYDNTKSFSDQNLLDETKIILFYLFEKFGASDNVKNRIREYKNYYLNLLEKEKAQKYNPDNLFKNEAKEKLKEEKKQPAEYLNVSENKMIEYKKETIFDRIKCFIKKVFKF